ncbi:MAG: aminopeptidase N, partial [Elusimicrobia bacterium]|nr:aminopeptidase N [Elusimicrobiota bacterium]
MRPRAAASAAVRVKLALICLCILSFVQCRTAPKKSPLQSATPLRGISRAEAELRKSMLLRADYALAFSLDAESGDFSGKAELAFDLQNADHALRIDFAGGRIKKLEVNGRNLPQPDYNGYFLSIPPQRLKAGANLISVEYDHPYSKNGSGFYRFRDPVDGETYLFTDFEPFNANSLFPCFDQPDIRATYRLNVEAPDAWTVISSAQETGAVSSGGRRTWLFPRTQAFSTYVFSLHAGPYSVWTSSAGAIPLRLFARKSLAQFVDAEDWFRVTRQGFDFFQEYFGVAYPFGKYDQVLVPDFNSGAMENVGAVTFSESFIYRSTPTYNDRQDRADVILHELSHMWFGDLVTMAWWDDLWLNESFATYMSHLALSRATEFKDAWHYFFNDSKQWAYWEDQLETTHPIAVDVPTTEHAFAQFDGITYGKGAAVVRQLSYFLGEDVFQKGVRNYFKKHAFQNTRLKDFIGALEEASGRDLGAWAHDWIESAGINTVKARFECAQDRVVSFALEQTAPPEQPRLRSHRTRLTLYRAHAKTGAPEAVKSLPVAYEGPLTEVPELAGEKCPDLVDLNDGDYDYVKTELDALTLRALKSHLAGLKNPQTRSAFLQALWDMAREGKLPVDAFVDAAMDAMRRESDLLILEKTLEKIHGRVAWPRASATFALYYLSKAPAPPEGR